MDGMPQTYPTGRQISPPLPSRHLPAYIKPLPARIGAHEVVYLSNKGALTIPPLPLRNALLRAFIEFVHPFMPLLDVPDLIDSVDRSDGTNQVSLLLFQAIMFSGVAMVDAQLLRSAGYATRREARREFFQKTRVSSLPLYSWRSTDYSSYYMTSTTSKIASPSFNLYC